MPFLGIFQADGGDQEQAEDEQRNRRVPVRRRQEEEAEDEGVDDGGGGYGDYEDAYVYVCAMVLFKTMIMMMTVMPNLIRMMGIMIMVLVVMIKSMLMIIFMVRLRIKRAFMMLFLGTLARRRRKRRMRTFLITERSQTLSPPSSTAQGASENSETFMDRGRLTILLTLYSQEDVPSPICT